MTRGVENPIPNQQYQLSQGEKSTLVTPDGIVIPLSKEEINKLSIAIESIQRRYDSEPGVIRELRASGFKFGCLQEGGWGLGDQTPI